MRRHLARSDERQSMPLSAASFLSGFLNRPKSSRGNTSTAAKIYPFATEPQKDFNLSPDRVQLDILGVVLDNFRPIQALLVVGEKLCDVQKAKFRLYLWSGSHFVT